MRSDIDIAQAATPRPLVEIARELGLTSDELIPYGQTIAKVPIGTAERLADRPDAKLILVSAMTPTAMGEGKTTTTIGLGQALTRIGKRLGYQPATDFREGLAKTLAWYRNG